MTEFTDYATLRIYIPPEYETLRSFYRHRIEDHNNALFTNLYADSGFDLGMPTDVDITKAVGVKNVFEDTPNPIQWIKNWTESKHVQVAPQETQIETYKVVSFKQDTSETDFSDFTF